MGVAFIMKHSLAESYQNTERPRRAVPKQDYVSLANCDIKLPRQAKRRQKDIHRVQNCSEENKLYRLKVLEEDANNSLVKVRYIGYSST